MNVREVLTKWGFDIEHEKLDKVEEQLEAIKHRLEFLAAAEVAKGLYELTEKFAHFAEELHVAASSAGIAVESFQKLAFSASQSGIQQDEMGKSLAILSRHLQGARNGSQEAAKAFERAGFSPEQVAGVKNSQQAMLILADRMKAIKDPIQKAALAQELLGRGSVKMVGYLSQGSAAIKAQGAEAEKLGIVLGEHQVEALVSLEHALTKVFLVFKNMAATIAAVVAPVFEYLINDFIKFFSANRALLEVNIINWLGEVAYAMGFLWEALKFGITLFRKFAEALGIQDHLLQLVASFFTLVTALLALRKAVNLVGSALAVLKDAWGIAKALWAVAAATWGALAPLLPYALAIGALIFVFHELYALLTGKQTWTGQFWEWLKSLDAIKTAMTWISNTWGALKDKFTGGLSAVKNFFGAGGPEAAKENLAAGASPASALSSISNASTTSTGGEVNVSAPINITAPAGSHQEVGKKVQEGVVDHLGRLFREASRSVTPKVEY